MGFDHTILNVPGKRDFRVLGNAFFGNANKEAYEGGSCEPGIIMVAYDANRNGRPDEDEWYEIEGSAHVDHTKEPWYTLVKTKVPGADLNFYRDFVDDLPPPAKEPESKDGWGTYIRWGGQQGQLRLQG